MDREEGLEDLRGETGDPLELEGTSLGKYLLEEFKRETNKKWLYKGRHPGLDLDICVKVLRPSIDEKSLLGEIENLKELTHPNIEQIFDAGIDGEHHYIVSRWIEGKNLRELIESETEFSQGEALELSCSILRALDHAYKNGHPHTDVKLENIMLEESRENDKSLYERVRVVDFGPWSSEDVTRHHVSGTAGILRELLNVGEGYEIPSNLESRIKKAEDLDYETPREFKNALEDFKKSVIRKKFLGATGIILLLSGMGYSISEYESYRNSMDYVVDEIAQIEATNHKRIVPLLKELAPRIFDKKIRPLIEEEEIPRGKSPYATTEKGNWQLTEGGFWTEGFFPGILWQGFRITGDSQFRDWAIEWTNTINFTEGDKNTTESIRFYYSHAKAFELTEDEFFRDQALRAAEFMASRFNKVGNFIQMDGEVRDSNIQEIQIGAMTAAIPLLSWAYSQTNDDLFRDIITEHCDATIQYNVNENGSTIQVMGFNPRTMTRIGGIKHYGFNENSCLSRGQARAIKGFATAYQATDEERFLEIAERCAGYFIDNLPKDFVPFYDFKDPNKNIPKDSSAASIASSALLDLYEMTGNEKHKIAAYNILKSLSSQNYLSTDLRNYQGLIMHGCSNKNRATYIDSSLIYGDYFYLESLRKIK